MTYVTNLKDPAVEQGQEETDKFKVEHLREQVMSWLGYATKRKKGMLIARSMAEARQEHLKLREKYLEGIGCWFFETHQYQRWLDGNCSTLVCPGIPGSGKTMLASEVVDRLDGRSRNQDFQGPTVVVFAYLNSKFDKDHSALELMKQLLGQLIGNCPWSDRLQDTEAWITRTPLSLGAVTKLAHKVGTLYHQVYIVVDAVDELDSAHEGANDLIACLQDLRDKSRAKLLFTLRNIPDIIKQLRDYTCIDIQADEEDVSKFVDRKLQNTDFRWSVEKLHSQTLKDELKKSIMLLSKDTFSLAEQAIDTLSTAPLKAAEDFVRSPSTSFVLDTLYQREAARIVKQREKYAVLAGQVLSLISFAKRSLTLPEIRQVLAFDISEQREGRASLNIHKHEVADALVYSCRGLIKIKPESLEVAWVHDSASVLVGPEAWRYFQSQLFQNFQAKPLRSFQAQTFQSFQAQTFQSFQSQAFQGFQPQLRIPSFLVDKLQTMCITCLAHFEFKSGPCRNDTLLEERLTRHPFYRYACRYWTQHVSPLGDKDKELLWRFLENDQSVAAAYQVFLATQEMPRSTGFSQVAPQGITGMHLAAHFGLHEILDELIKRRVDDIAVKDSNGHTPLWWAAEGKMKETAKILIPRDYETVSSLVRSGDLDLILLLLDAEYDTNRRGAWGRTLLHNAIMEDKPIIAHKLLEKNAKFDEADINGDTPLTLALQKGQHQIADILLDMGASTKSTTLEQWRQAYSKPDCSVMQLTRTTRKTSLKFLEGETQDNMESPAQHQAMNLFVFSAPSSPAWLQSNRLSPSLQHESSWQGPVITYVVVLKFPVGITMEQKTGSSLPPMLPIGIKWSIIKDENAKAGFRRLAHYHNLPDTWIAEEMLHMYLQLLKQMRIRWEMTCEEGELHLRHCREEILNAKGEDLELTDQLLKDAQQWITLRRELARHVTDATQFVSEYNRLYQEEKAHGDCQEFLHKFRFDIEQNLNSLDTTSQNLISIEFNLVTIREARKSVTMSASLKRLSWITFVFLPATFSASLFGMNVDILRDNPSWKWYILVGGGCMLLTFTGWLLFKFTTLEAWLDRMTNNTTARLDREKRKQKTTLHATVA